MNELKGTRIGLALTGSFCTFSKAFALAESLTEHGADLTGIMSFNASREDTKFGRAANHISKLEKITGKHVIRSIVDAEPIGPANMLDILVVAPCTGNTAAKLAYSIVDTPVTMAVKSHLRGGKPVILAICTNDADSGAAMNIGLLRNRRSYTIIPTYRDDPINKPFSRIADFGEIIETVKKIRGLN